MSNAVRMYNAMHVKYTFHVLKVSAYFTCKIRVKYV